jgi:hypothetical protein
MDFQNFTSTPEFQQLHPVKQQIIREMVQNNLHTSPETLLPKIMMLNRELSKRNLSFTKKETEMLIGLMKSDMPPEEQKKVDLLMGLFNR